VSNAARHLDGHFERAAMAGSAAAKLRDLARGKAVRVVRELERRLVEALDGGTLRGLRTLAPEEAGPYYAANVRVGGRHGIDTWLRGEDVLCIDKDGRLVMAGLWDDGPVPVSYVRAHPARDEELRAEDAEAMASAVRQVLERHAAASARTGERHARAGAAAEELARALGMTL
jgi:hypothetical protein